MSLSDRGVYNECHVRVPKYRPKLICSICRIPKHYKCQKLSTTEAEALIRNTEYYNNWSCNHCLINILPINACHRVPRLKHNLHAPKPYVTCGACDRKSYAIDKLITCGWCNLKCHLKCSNNLLGCDRCCEDIIPGFHVFNHELAAQHIGFSTNITHNPYNRDHIINQIGDNLDDIAMADSDRQWNEISDFLLKCKYVEPNRIAASKADELKILSLNIRSLNKNVPIINENYDHFNKYDVLCFNETNCDVGKLANGMDDLLLEGFHPPLLRAPNRVTCKGGGLATYVNKNLCEFDDLEVLEPKDVDLNTRECELLFLKLKRYKSINKSMIVCNMYRSPSRQPDKFIEFIDQTLARINRHKNKHILIVGDFNVDLLKYENDVNSQNLIDTMASYSFIQTVAKPTRITDHSATLIDHVYSNKVASVTSTNLATYDLSDHLGVVTTVLISKQSENFMSPTIKREHENREYRVFNTSNTDQFHNLIMGESWEAVHSENDAQLKYEKFAKLYNKHYDTAFPLKKNTKRRKNERKNAKPWILPWLEDACARKNRFYHEFIKYPTQVNKLKYVKMKKFVDRHILKAKNKYYSDYFKEHKSNSRKQWQMINSLLNRNRKKVAVTKLIDSDGTVVNTPIDIAENFNKFFADVATKLKSETASHDSTPRDITFDRFINARVSNTIFLSPVEQEEVGDIIDNFKNKATMDTKISALKVANVHCNFREVVAAIVNASFEQGVFPKPLKTAKVVPIHKGDSKTDVGNYRPISLLSTFSKIYEKTMHSRITNFMESNQSLFDMQYGFRKGRSCEHALLAAQNCILDTLNKNEIALLLLIDFSKAFDMVDHDILLSKLSRYGIRGNALKWMQSYLRDRRQYVTIDGKNSSERDLKFGVPQGSILGPLLFIIYINDLPNIHKFARFIMYADDANIIITGKDIHEVTEQARTLCNTLSQWVNCNGLKLNLTKTNFMIFSRNRTVNSHTFSLTINNTLLKRTPSARFLGVLVDEKLTWNSHIIAIRRKMSRYIGILYKLKSILPLAARLLIYHSLIQSHVNYCSLVWGFACKSNIETIFRAQKKGLRAVMPGFVNYFYKDGNTPHHTKAAFKEYGILTIQNVIVKNAMLFMYKYHRQRGQICRSLPLSMVATIRDDAPTIVSTHETCSDWLATYSTKSFCKSLFYKGPLLLTDFMQIETLSLSLISAKNAIKKQLLVTQGGGESEEWLNQNFKLYNIRGLRKSTRMAQPSNAQF